MESSPLSDNGDLAMQRVDVGHDDASNGDTSTDGVFSKSTHRGPAWMLRTDLRRELVMRALIGFVLLLIGALIGMWLCSHNASAMCDSGWASHGGYCYKLLENKTFPQADHACRFEHGAQLTSIHSKSELEFVAMLSVNEMHDDHRGAWIGLHRPVGAHSTWQWLDGSELDYTNWSDIDGNTKLENARSNQHWCVLILNGGWLHHKQWLYRDGEDTESAICKKEPR